MAVHWATKASLERNCVRVWLADELRSTLLSGWLELTALQVSKRTDTGNLAVKTSSRRHRQ